MDPSIPALDLSFQLSAPEPIPVDHGYALYGAISRLVPEVHQQNQVGVHPIRGLQVGDRRLQLQTWSALTVRVLDGQVAPLLKLSGKQLNLDGANVRVGIPQVHALMPSAALRSRLVLIKVSQLTSQSLLTDQLFRDAVQRQLQKLEISSDYVIHIGKRRTMQMKQTELVGFEVILEGLTADESLKLQRHGIGGKRHMGCGILSIHQTRTGK